MLEFAQTPEMIELLLNNGVKMTQKNIRRNYWLGKYIEDANKRQKAYQQLSSAQLPTSLFQPISLFLSLSLFYFYL